MELALDFRGQQVFVALADDACAVTADELHTPLIDKLQPQVGVVNQKRVGDAI